MEISGIITAIVIGAIIGALGRLVVPGRQNIQAPSDLTAHLTD